MKKVSVLWMLALVFILSLVMTSIIISQQPDQPPNQPQDRNRMRQGGTQDRQFDPATMLKQRVDRTMEQLKLPEDEASVLRPMIEKILQTRMDQSQEIRDLTNSLREAVNAKDTEKIKSSLTNIKAKREANRIKIEAMEKELLEFLTLEQEANLTLSGIVNSDGMGGFFGGFGGPGGPGQDRGNRPGGDRPGAQRQQQN